uniref:Uncharacterized protein n=1 Tax=Caenorhabditis japonica TaxID=281687 RepID=A0A8R1II53_CAEJA
AKNTVEPNKQEHRLVQWPRTPHSPMAKNTAEPTTRVDRKSRKGTLEASGARRFGQQADRKR